MNQVMRNKRVLVARVRRLGQMDGAETSLYLRSRPKSVCRSLFEHWTGFRFFANLAIMRNHSEQKHEIGGDDSAAVAAQCARLLVALRTAAGETQKQLATRLGMTISMVSRLERGDHVPSVATLCRIAEAFDRRLQIVFHEHEHLHRDGTRHSHGHEHSDPEHQHEHDD